MSEKHFPETDEAFESPQVSHAREQFKSVDTRVNAMRSRLKNDPDDAFDKLIKFALPAVAGFAVSKLADFLWNSGKKRILGDKAIDANGDTVRDGIFASMLFAGFSATLGSLVSSLADRSSVGIVNARHKKAERNENSRARRK